MVAVVGSRVAAIGWNWHCCIMELAICKRVDFPYVGYIQYIYTLIILYIDVLYMILNIYIYIFPVNIGYTVLPSIVI